MRIRGWLPALIALLLVFVPALAGADGGLSSEKPFAESGFAELDGWREDMWDSSGLSVLEVTDAGENGESCLHIVNVGENDARFARTVSVEPDTIYVIRARVRAEGCGTDGVGANLSIEYTFSYSDPVYDTAGEWVTVELYGMTGPAQTECTVYCRLGGYSSTTTGEVWFTDLSMQRLEEAPENVFVQLFDTGESVESSDIDTDDLFDAEPSFGSETFIAIVWVLFSIAICLYSARRGAVNSTSLTVVSDTSGSRLLPSAYMLPALLLAAFVVRTLYAISTRGFATDMGCFLSWSSRVFHVGPVSFYADGYFCDYPPGYIYVLWLTGALRAAFGLTGDGPASWFIIKLPCILADLIACVLVYRISCRHIGKRSALAIAAFYACNPAVVLNSSLWGQTDGLLSLLLACSLYLAVDRKWLYCLPVYALAVLVKPQALLFAPLGLFVMGTEVARTARREEKTSAVIGTLVAVALLLLLSLPFGWSQASAWFPDAPRVLRPVLWLIEKYASTLGSYSYYSVNACNLWQLLNRNWMALDGGFAEILGWVTFAVSYGFVFWMYWKAKEPKRVFLLGATLMALLFFFGLKMHERYLMPAILFLCIAYAFERDTRIFIAAVLLTCALFWNAALVLKYTFLFDGPGWASTVSSLLCLSGCGLLVWTCLDLCLRGRVMGITRIYRPSWLRMRQQETQAHKAAGVGLFVQKDWRLRLTQAEILLLLLVTALAAVFSFVNLGTTSAPQTGWTAQEAGESVVFDLGEERSFHMTYYGGICDTTFTVEFSSDGDIYTQPEYALYNQGEIFRWLWFRPMTRDEAGNLSAKTPLYQYDTARYIRITAADAELLLYEVAFLSEEGVPYPVAAVSSDRAVADPTMLVDEQDVVPAYPSYYNGTYFDEIYHVRTAYEHIHGMHAYEWTHPPFGKLLIGLGIRLFGMTPFGWRFMGALAGVLMVPLMYLLARQFVKNKFAAIFAMTLMALDCMRFTQTRLGTIDCFAVLFIMGMYFFMFRYCKMSFFREPLGRTLLPLALCGITFALGCATKWICIYAGVGLAALFFYTLCRRFFEYRFAKSGMRAFAPNEKLVAQRAESCFARNTVITLLWCVLFFVALPLVVYYLSYYWQLTPDGNFTVAGVVDLQKSIFEYHNGLSNDMHYFRSPWYEWPLIVKPMWYFSGTDFMPTGWISSISCMGNPAVWWGGLVGLIYCAIRLPSSLRSGDRRKLYLLIGFLSQFAPWILVARSTFIYHYFASVPFIVLCAAMLLDDLFGHDRKLAVRVGAIWMGAAAVLCAGFYPLMSGTPIPRAYANWLRWFHWYNF